MDIAREQMVLNLEIKSSCKGAPEPALHSKIAWVGDLELSPVVIIDGHEVDHARLQSPVVDGKEVDVA